MSLIRWDSPTDTFASGDLVTNANTIDIHDHTPAKGVQIPTAGLQNQSVTNGKLAAASVTTDKLASSGVQTVNISDLSVTTAKLADQGVTLAKLGPDVVADYSNTYSTWKTILPWQGGLISTGGLTVGTYPLGGSTAFPVGSNNVSYLDPADYTAGTRTTNFRLSAILITNSIPPGTVTFTIGLYPISSFNYGGSGSSDTVNVTSPTTGSTAAFVSPSASTNTRVVSSEFAAPTAGYFIFGVAISVNTTAVNSVERVLATLQMRQVP